MTTEDKVSNKEIWDDFKKLAGKIFDQSKEESEQALDEIQKKLELKQAQEKEREPI